jgi:gluconate 2-dehydrogenase gamma chain
MNRRDLLRVLGATAAVPAFSAASGERLVAAARRAHHRVRARGFQVLDPHQREVVATLTEILIPTTDTPGARTAGVPEFIDLLLAEWAPDDERARFLKGIDDVDARARAAFGTDFLGATEAQRATIVGQLDGELQALREKQANLQEHFFQRVKFLTVFGYCSSEVGATQVLHYEVIPGSFDPCVELGRWRAAPGDF